MHRLIAWLAAGLLAASLPCLAAAQETDARSPWSISAFGGVLMVDDGELDAVGMELDNSLIFGARVGRMLNERWEVEGSYGYAPLNGTSEGFGEIDGRLHAYDVSIAYLLPLGERSRLRLSAGVGGVRYSYDEFERDGVLLQNESWANELVIPLGAGLEFDVTPRVAVRLDARDLLQMCSEEEEPIEETEDFSHCPLDSTLLSNPELSAGIAIHP